jgi:hypothetical protein
MPLLDQYAETPVNLQLISGALALGIEPSAGYLEFYFVLSVVSGNLQVSSNPKELRSKTDFGITALSYTMLSKTSLTSPAFILSV